MEFTSCGSSEQQDKGGYFFVYNTWSCLTYMYEGLITWFPCFTSYAKFQLLQFSLPMPTAQVTEFVILPPPLPSLQISTKAS